MKLKAEIDMKKIMILVAAFIIVSIIFTVYYFEGSLPVKKNDRTTKIFVIKRGESVTQIARNLEKQDLIRNRLVFFLIVKRLGIDQKVQAGDYRLSPNMDASSIAKNLTKGTLDIWITIIEGLRREEIAQIIGHELQIPESEFLADAQEGYLFPDTYLVPKNATVNTIINIFKSNLDRKYDEDLQQKTQAKDLTQSEVFILASLVEKEAKTLRDKQIVASILYKRLKQSWPLQVDATVQYALGYQRDQKTWWKKNLTKTDLEIESAYNTYLNLGLPPAPINSPGLNSIKAVLDANENTPYWYYISSADGSKMYFAKTIEEHNQNIARYLR